jgi:hypothetical protein
MAGREKGIGRTRPKREFSPAQLDRVRALNDVPHKGRGKAEKALARKLETSPRTLQRLRHDL